MSGSGLARNAHDGAVVEQKAVAIAQGNRVPQIEQEPVPRSVVSTMRRRWRS